jgi:hypothetical protein
MGDDMRQPSRKRIGLRLSVGAVAIAGSVLVATAGRAQDAAPAAQILRGALDAATDAGAVTDSAADAASDSAPDAMASDPPPATADATPDDSNIDWSMLDNAAPSLDADAPARPLRAPGAPASAPALDVTRTDRPDGSASASITQPLTAPWGTKIGAGVNLAAPPATTFAPDRALPGTTGGNNSGSAWLSTDAPGVGTLGARVDARQDQSKLATSFERSVPLGDDISVTVHGGLGVTENSGAPAITGSVPLAALPPAPASGPARVLDSEKLVKLNILPTGTTLGAGVRSATSDAVTHNTLSADQQLYGPLHVTGTVTDVGQAASSKSITAGIKLTW